MQAIRDWQKIFKEKKSKDLQPRLLYLGKLSFRMEGQKECFPDKVKLKEFIITKPLLYEVLGLICIGIQGIYVKLISHCPAVMMKQ